MRSDHPFRAVAVAIDFRFVREEVARCYGAKGNVSIDLEVIMKMMFLLFFDDVASERDIADFSSVTLFQKPSLFYRAVQKVRLGGTPRPARETRALPR